MNPSIISSLPPKAPKETPPPRYFPNVIKSGKISRSPCLPPGANLDVITSSKINSVPVSLVVLRRVSRNSLDAGIQPLEPIMGSTITQAS